MSIRTVRSRRAALAVALPLALVVPAASPAQTLPVDDPVLRRIWSLGMDSTQTPRLLQALTDSIGPRLTGTPEYAAGSRWLIDTYRRWGITARQERYGTWKGWERGVTHVDLVAPRVRTLDAMPLSWSAGTNGRDVDGAVVTIPQLADSAAFSQWLPSVRGKFVLVSFPQPTCRPDENWEKWATPESFARMKSERDSARERFAQNLERTGYALSLGTGTLGRRLEQAGAAGVIASRWSDGWGVNKVFHARTERVPSLDMSCEDYGMLHRMADAAQGPRLRVRSTARATGTVPTFNTVAEIRGGERPDEYVMLSAHFDSWDGATGATDNGTGTVTMLEAMRILRTAYPRPKRTIVVGHWASEEQGLNGSRAFVAAHPEIVRGLQALFNQDNGTGRVSNVSAFGLVGAGEAWGRWASRLPEEISQHIRYSFPGSPSAGGSDHSSFVCAGAPAFMLGSNSWDYGTYTWHTNRDTYDKVSFDDVKNNATLVAMLVYLASEDPEATGRARRVMPVVARTGQQAQWPECRPPVARWEDYTR
jgi:hypothetical protein